MDRIGSALLEDKTNHWPLDATHINRVCEAAPDTLFSFEAMMHAAIDIAKNATGLRAKAALPFADGGSGGGRSKFRAAFDSVYLQRFHVHPNPRFDVAVTVALIAAVAVSRWLAMPASIWDQDEAIFATALVHFDPSQNYPHPPFFPLWILLGKALMGLAPWLEPDRALQFLSAALSVWMVFPMVALWSLMLPRRKAFIAALVFSFLPAPWLLAGRAYTSTAATAFLVAALASWLRPATSRRKTVTGSLWIAAALLTRPQWLPIAAVVCTWRSVCGRDWWSRVVPFLIPAAIGLPVAGFFVASVGGLAPSLHAVGQHGMYHVGAYVRFSWQLSEMGILHACGSAAWGAVWLLLAAEGTVELLLDSDTRAMARRLVLTALIPLLALLLLAQNPTFSRYAIPYLALTAGPVVVAVTSLFGRHSAAAILIAVAALVLAASPRIAEYRKHPSPAFRALSEVIATPVKGVHHLVADRSLDPFIELFRRRRGLECTVTWTRGLRNGLHIWSQANTVAVIDRGRAPWYIGGSNAVRHVCDDPWLRRLASPRLVDMLVVFATTPDPEEGSEHAGRARVNDYQDRWESPSRPVQP